MLDPESIDLQELCVALDDHSPEVSWWIDPATGAVKPHIPDVDGEHTPEEEGWTWIDPVSSHDSYQDMADFAAAVPDRVTADRLERAITGRGAFRRFKDTVHESPELRARWYAFRDARAGRRALDWLASTGLVAQEAADRAAGKYTDPPLVANPLASAVAADLAQLYGDRLTEVLIFGSRARGDHTDESDLDLLVVLVDPVDKWHELDVMDEVLWRHTLESGIVVSAMAVGSAQWGDPTTPFLLRAAAEGVRVA